MRPFDFAPLYRSTIGFDRLATLLDSMATSGEDVGYPPYNIERLAEATYRITIAVAGFGILAIFFMIVVEKTRDIGILKSLGACGRGIMGIFLSYGLSLGMAGIPASRHRSAQLRATVPVG